LGKKRDKKGQQRRRKRQNVSAVRRKKKMLPTKGRGKKLPLSFLEKLSRHQKKGSPVEKGL